MNKIAMAATLVAVFAAAGCATAPPVTVVRYYPTEGAITETPRQPVGATFTIVNATDGALAVIHDGRRRARLKPGQSFGFEMSHNRYGVMETSVTVVGKKTGGRPFAISRKFLVGCREGWISGMDCRWRSYSWTVSRWSVLFAGDAPSEDTEVLKLFAMDGVGERA